MSDYKVLFTAADFKARLLDIVRNYKSIYMYAAYGWQVTDETIADKAKQNCNGWYTSSRIKTLQKVANQTPPTWGFDCVNLLKAIFWGWNGDTSKKKGGSKYGTNTVPDTNADGMFKRCTDQSADFSNIEMGEAVWLSGHIGVYIGDGLVVECTPKWDNCVQISYLANVGEVSGYPGRTWKKHGKLPWIKYNAADAVVPIAPEKPAEPAKPAEPEKVYKLGDRALMRKSPVMTGADVKDMQARLNALGYDCGAADGKYGPNTEKGVKAFQKAAGIEVDGKFGPASFAALKAAESAGSAADDDWYTVRKYDTLWGLAKEWLGKGAKYPIIMQLNNLTSTTLQIGQKLKKPEKPKQ